MENFNVTFDPTKDYTSLLDAELLVDYFSQGEETLIGKTSKVEVIFDKKNNSIEIFSGDDPIIGAFLNSNTFKDADSNNDSLSRQIANSITNLSLKL